MNKVIDYDQYLNTAWAKSDGTSIRQHTDKLLDNLNKLKERYGKHIELACPPSYRDILWESIKLACEYHDYGKLHWVFQHKVGNTKHKKYKTPEVRHNLLSPAFLPKDLKDPQKTLVALTIIHHHDVNLSSEEVRKVREVLEKEFGINLEEWLASLLSKEEYSVLKRKLREFNGRFNKPENETLQFYQLLKGLLLRIDHASSNNQLPVIEEEPLKDNHSKVESYIKQKHSSGLNDLQRFVLDNIDKNLVVIASTGYGKTEAGLIFLQEKGFFTTPIRTSVNSLYQRALEIFEKENVGLLHSTAINFLMEDIPEERNEDVYQILLDYERAKHFSKPLIFSTPDQIFPYVFRFKGFEKYYSLFANSRIVIDEIQLFEPYTLGFLVKGLEYATKLGSKVMVMTATLPKFVKKDLQSFLKTKPKEFLNPNTRHNLKLIQDGINNATDVVKQLSQKGKVLIITNMVKRAVEVYQNLKNSNLNPKLLHSRFILKERMNREGEIREFFDGCGKGIWITTQLAEVSLDIDADYLITELSTLDSLFQRLGRVNRRGNKPVEEPNAYVFLNDCSGIGSVYRKSLHELSIKNLKEGKLTEKEKVKAIEEMYDEKVLDGKDKKYLEDYKQAKEYIENLWTAYSYIDGQQKKEAQQLFRDINSVTVIPTKYKNDVKNLITQLGQAKNVGDKIKLINQILGYSFSIPTWYSYLKNISPINELKKFNLYWIDVNYDDELGLYNLSNDPELSVII